MNAKKGQWIKLKQTIESAGLDAYVLKVFSEKHIEIGYYQNNRKAIGEEAIWDNNGFWCFKYEGLGGRYLSGSEESIVKTGRYRK